MSTTNVGRTLRTLVNSLLDVVSEYSFDGRIDEERVRFYKTWLAENFLQITKPDGTVVRYEALNPVGYEAPNRDLKVEVVKIIDSGRTVVRFSLNSSNPEERKLFPEFQKQFEKYLGTILEINSSKVLDP